MLRPSYLGSKLVGRSTGSDSTSFGKDDWGIVDAGLFEVILWLQAPQSTNHENMPEDLPFDKDYEAAIVLQVLAWSFKAMCWMHVLTSLVCKLAKHDAIVSNR